MSLLRENSDPTVVPSSSIAILQERFKQLHRVKKMRQKQKHLQKLSHVPKRQFELYPSMMKLTQYDQGSVPSGALFFHFLPIKTTATTTTSRSMNTTTISKPVSGSTQRSFELETPVMSRRLVDVDRHQVCAHERNIGSTTCNSGAVDSDDVDTSLHL